MDALLRIRHGSPIEALPLLQKALDEIETLPAHRDVEYMRATLYNSLGTMYSQLGQYKASVENFQKAADIMEAAGDLSWVATYTLNVADDSFLKGHYDRSEAAMEKGFRLASQVGDLDNQAYAYAIHGTLALAQKHPKMAREYLKKALDLTKQVDSGWNLPYIYANLARADLAMNDIPNAYRLAKLGVTHGQQMAFELAYALDVLAVVEAARQDRDAAFAHFQQAINISQPCGRLHYTGRAQLHMAQALVEKGEFEKALPVLTAALAIFHDLDVHPEIAEAEDLLKKIQVG